MLLLTLFFACQVTHRPGCETETTSVEDDETLGELGFTVDELLERIGGLRQIEASDAESVEHQLGVETTRAAGMAMFTKATPTDEETVGFGFGEATLQIAVVCEDRVEVPAEVSVVDEAGLVSILAAATLTIEAVRSGNTAEPGVSATLSTADVVPGWDGSGDVGLYMLYEGTSIADFSVGREGVSENLLVSVGE